MNRKMHAKDWILVFYLVWVGFAACEPWVEDKWDPDMSRYIKPMDIGMEYDQWQAATFGRVFETTDISQSKDAHIENFDRVQEGEATYTAIIFGYADENKGKAYGSSQVPLFGDCGAVLITTDTLLTICACVTSWLLWMKNTQGKGELKQDSRSIRDYDIARKDIYVWYGETVFEPWNHDWRIKLSNDPKKQIMKNDWCWEALFTCNINIYSETLCQRVNPVVLKFDVPWSYSPQTLIPWPPSQFYYTKKWSDKIVGPPPNYGKYRKAYHYSYRFKTVDTFDGELYNEYGDWLDLGAQLVQWNKTFDQLSKCEPLDPCLPKGKCPTEAQWRLKEGITCFTGESKQVICGGSFGSPVYGADYGLHGLAMTVYPCGKATGRRDPTSTLEVMAITPRMAEYIEGLIPDLVDSSKELLAADSLYRDASDYKMYDMVKYKFEVLDYPHPFGQGEKVKPHWVTNTLIFVCLGRGLVY